MKKTIMVLFLALASVSWGLASNTTIVDDNKALRTSGIGEWQHFEVP